MESIDKTYSMKLKFLLIFLFLLILIFTFNVIFLNSPVEGFFDNKDYPTAKIDEPIYVMIYIGDIDGEVSNDWFFFYEKLTKFYKKEKIPVTFSFYPGTLGDEEFSKIFLDIYDTENIELMQKSFMGDDSEKKMYQLSAEEQREIIRKGQDAYKKEIIKILKENNRDYSDIKIPIAYNQIGGIITNETRDVLWSLGFKLYFDVFVEDGYQPVSSTTTFDVLEYGESFTITGRAGREHNFKTPLEITNGINSYQRDDVDVITVNGKKVIPLYAHQQHFEDKTKDNKLDREKWNIYVYTIKKLNSDPNVKFITPSKLYWMRH